MRKEMNVKDFVPAIVQWLKMHGASELVSSTPEFPEWTIYTKAGMLSVYPIASFKNKRWTSLTVFTRFAIPSEAVLLLGRGACNPYSGKWNHYYFRSESWTPRDAFDAVTDLLSEVLP